MKKSTLGALAALSLAMLSAQAMAAKNMLYYSLPSGVKVQTTNAGGSEGSGGVTTPGGDNGVGGTDPAVPDDVTLAQTAGADFGTIIVGQSGEKSVILAASGSKGSLALGGFGVTGAGLTLKSNDCPASLPVGHSCQVTIAANPTQELLVNGALTFNAGSAVSVPVTMNGLMPLALGPVAFGSYTAEMPFTSLDLPTGLEVRFETPQAGQAKYALSSGTLPAGVTLSADGTLRGTPTTAGDYAFGVTATYKTYTASRSYTLPILASLPNDLTFSASSVIPVYAFVGQTVTAEGYVSVKGTSGKITYGSISVTGEGLSKGSSQSCENATRYAGSSACVIGLSYVATEAGQFEGRVTMPTTNGKGTVSIPVVISVTQPFQIGLAQPGAATPGAYYNDTSLREAFRVESNYDSYLTADDVTWKVTWGSLPPGITLDHGTLSGVIPAGTRPTIHAFELEVTHQGATSTNSYSIVVN